MDTRFFCLTNSWQGFAMTAGFQFCQIFSLALPVACQQQNIFHILTPLKRVRLLSPTLDMWMVEMKLLSPEKYGSNFQREKLLRRKLQRKRGSLIIGLQMIL